MRILAAGGIVAAMTQSTRQKLSLQSDARRKREDRHRRRFRFAARAVTVLAATVAAVLAWTVVAPLLGFELTRTDSTGAVVPISPGGVAGVAMLAGAAGWALLAVVEYFTKSTVGAWPVVVIGLAVVCLAGPLEAGSLAATITLIVMNVIVNTVVVQALSRRRRWR
jgi:hypothetical protein